MVDVRTVQAGRNREDRKRANWSKWMVAAVASLAIVSSAPGCGQNEDPIPTIPPVGDGGVITDGGAGGDGGMDGGRCIPPTVPPCFSQSRTETMHVGEVFVEGDFQFRLNTTREVDGEQVATVDILDSCGALIRSVDIKENETITRDVEGTNIRLEVKAESVTVTSPQSATITARMICTGTGSDGGVVTDGGSSGGDGGSGGTTDSGTGGTDGGGLVDGGMDSGTGGDGGSGGDGGAGGDGGMSGDGGSTTTDGGADGGTGGMDGGVIDGGSEGGADGGVIDGGMGGDGGSMTDGGSEGGMDGGPVDGGAPDGGFIDGGAIPGTCSGTFPESRTGLWPINVGVGNGGYQFKFTGQTGSGVTYEIRCSADMSLLGTASIDENVPYVFTTSGPYRVYMTNWASSSINSSSTINVAP
ncbi:MAG TPA: hypothetical protein VLD37_06205 [Candidatus Bilamarchaeum sp.]|nr:hypothetical protein [Candidatus Bilamarchaeum sp.]